MSEPTLDQAVATAPQSKGVILGKLAELLDRSGISIEEVGKVQRINLWQGFMKNAEGEAELVDLAGIQLLPKWAEGPAWPTITAGPSVRLSAASVKPRKGGDYKRCVVLPDIQIGYYRDIDGTLKATHDEQALAVALALTTSIDPDVIVLVGDNLDLPEFAKYRLSPAFQRTTQATIDRATTLGAELRRAAPRAKIIWLAGNHEERLPNWILDNAKASFGLKQGNTPESWPVMSVPHLCRLDDVGVEYRPGYPTSKYYINDKIKVIHGNKVRSNGSTAHAYLNEEKMSVIYGHIHRREWAERTREDFDGLKTILAVSPGCLARIDGPVPSTKGGIDLDGRPLPNCEDWQQGICVVEYEEGDGMFSLEQVPIRSGWARYRGVDFISDKIEA